MFSYIKQNKRGFTLIELLVVIAIIGILASVVLASLNSARAKAHDARVVSDFEQLGKALQLYYSDYGTVPVYTNANCCSGDHQEKYRRMAQDLVDGGYMPSIPIPPSSSYAYNYYYYGSTIGGILVTTLQTIQPTTVPPYNSCRPFTNNWCSYTTASRYYCTCNI